MIIYRDQRRSVSTREMLARFSTGDVRDLLIGFGQFESGIADACGQDAGELRRIAVLLGRMFYRSIKRLRAVDLTAELNHELAALTRLRLPETVEIREPEGYAFYGLFPESYIAAAEEFFSETQSQKALCIGIRSIGTSLSAVVAGALAELGVAVETCTVRPHGHPFDRITTLPSIASHRVPHLIVDEGPGLSGSSIASVAEALSNAGVPDSHIIFFPNWRPDPAALVSMKARDRWRRHRAFAGSFDPEMAHRGMRGWRDISAGQWRELLYSHPDDYPAAHPQHERRKFLNPCEPRVLAKFVGFGARGRDCMRRSQALHDAGFIPPPTELSNGFLFSSFVPGRPVSKISAPLLDRMAGYLAHIARSGAQPPPPPSELVTMMTVNISEALNIEWQPAPNLFEAFAAPAHILDGRMLAHEWIETSSGFLKTDAVDHADDHFFPGPQNIAWDLAAAAIEFGLEDASPLLDRYARLTGDREIQRRLPFYALAYSAFRLGYCRIAQMSLAGVERDRFGRLESRYLRAIHRYSGVPRREASSTEYALQGDVHGADRSRR